MGGVAGELLPAQSLLTSDPDASALLLGLENLRERPKHCGHSGSRLAFPSPLPDIRGWKGCLQGDRNFGVLTLTQTDPREKSQNVSFQKKPKS